MTPTHLNYLTKAIYEDLCKETSSPQEAMHVIAAVAYVIWRNAMHQSRRPQEPHYPLAKVLAEFSNAVRELHEMNTVKGSA